MKEAMLYEQLPENKVKCNLCGRRCTIPEGSAGFCLVSKNEKGKLHSFVYACMQVSRYVGDLET